MWAALTGACASLEFASQTVGLDQLDPERTYVFMSNHVSNIDPPIMLPLIPRRTSVMAKKELFDYPMLGKTMRLGSLVPVDRAIGMPESRPCGPPRRSCGRASI